MRNELYFLTFLTESEHGFVESDIKEYCANNNLEFVYYRKIKGGHIPMWREVKVRGNVGKFKKWAKEQLFLNLFSQKDVEEKERKKWESLMKEGSNL